MAKKDEVLKHKELGKVVVKQDNRDDGQKLKDFIKENISSMLGSDGEPDLGKIRDILGLSSLNGYELKFPGKGIANALYSAPIYKELKNIDENKSNKINENFIIKGDNLDALKILAKGYTNKIKMIYIDPPYNTMNNDFIYNDNFRADFDAIARISGLIDESGNKSKNLEEMERIFKGTRTHSAWLCFMYPRLKLARDLLKDDGVIFISIDDNEQANLKLLCDEIFGEENFVGNLPTIMNLKGNNDEFGFAGTHEYTIVFAKNKDKLRIGEFDISDDEIEDWQFDEKGYYKQGANLKRTGQNAPREDRPNLYFPILINKTNSKVVSITESEYEAIYDKNTKKFNDDYLEALKNEYENKGFYFILPITNNQKVTWRWSYNKILAESDEIIISQNGTIGLYKKQRPSLGDIPSKKPKSLLYKPTYSSGNGTELIKKIFASKVFSNPKPLDLIKDIIKISTNNKDIILDFFAGSGTTAHAVMAQNLADNGNRKFILVQLDEKLDPENKNQKVAFDFCKNELKSENPNISDITIERVKRAKKTLNSQMEFSVYEMTDEPDIDVEENLFGVRLEKNTLDLVTNMLLKSGNEISGKNIECVIENRLYKVGNDYFVLDLLQKDDKELFKVLDKDRNGNVYADIYINCDIEVWLNFYAKFKERLRIL